MNQKYRNYLQSDEWRALRRQVYARAYGICERCDGHELSHVHHLTYERIFKEELEDLQGLCVFCHEFVHGKRKLDPRKVPSFEELFELIRNLRC